MSTTREKTGPCPTTLASGVSWWGKTPFSICSRNIGPIFITNCSRDSKHPIRHLSAWPTLLALMASYGLGHKRTNSLEVSAHGYVGAHVRVDSLPGPSLLYRSDCFRSGSAL